MQVDRGVGQIDERQADLGGQGLHELGLGEDTLFDQDPAQAPADALVLVVGRGELFIVDQSRVEQDVGELPHPPRPSLMVTDVGSGGNALEPQPRRSARRSSSPCPARRSTSTSIRCPVINRT